MHAYYRPGAWHPHCTMAINVAEALMHGVRAACESSVGTGLVRVKRVQVVRYRPATVVEDVELQPL